MDMHFQYMQAFVSSYQAGASGRSILPTLVKPAQEMKMSPQIPVCQET